MSFTSKIKTEISKQKYNKLEKITLLSGIIKNENINDTIKIQTENKEVANMVFNLFQEIYNIILQLEKDIIIIKTISTSLKYKIRTKK